MPSLTEKIKHIAHGLGFTLTGVTTGEDIASHPSYQDWIAQGYHGEMGYLARPDAVQRRSAPKEILPECQSVLVLGIPYDAPSLNSPTPLAGQVAAYAWHDDYHDVLKPRLQSIVSFIETESGQEVLNRWYTDTGPILERELAQRAGLGWLGKNSMLINPQSGSYFLLAEILLGIPLEPDTPFSTDHCGTCTRCIAACPTDCILPNRTLDAQRCISYLTIELKGAIPTALRPQIGNWVFGCDLCQQVCPWNIRFAPLHGDAAFAPRPDVPRVNLVQELALSPEDFNRKFKDSPVKRSKRRGYLRNVAVALGNSGDPAVIPSLVTALLTDPEPLVRQHAAWALGEIGGEDAVEGLEQAKAIETDLQVLKEIEIALGNKKDA